MASRKFVLGSFCLLAAACSAVGQTQSAAPQGSIEGRTTSIDGQPLRKTNLTLRPIQVGPGGGGGAGFQPPAPYATTSDADGKFSFTGLEAGRYTLAADHSGYINTQYGTKRTSGGGQTGNPILTLSAGQHLTGINVELPPQATISGKVTDEDGDPMPRIRVSAMRKNYALGAARMMNSASAMTDDNGDYHLTNMTAGRYYISFAPQRVGPQGARRAGGDAAGPETGYGTVYFPGSQDLEGAVPVDAVEGQDKAGMNVRMRKVPVFHIRGTIGGDLPAPDPTMPAAMAGRLQISVSPPGGMLAGALNMQATNPDGSFDIAGLTPGVWSVAVMKAQGQIQVLSQTTVVISNRDVTDLKVMAKAPVDITGLVRIVPDGAAAIAPAIQPQGGGPNAGRGGSQPANPALGQLGGGQPFGGPASGRGASGRGAGGGQSGAGAAQQAPQVRIQVTLDPVDGLTLGGSVQPGPMQADGSFVIHNVPPLSYRVMAVAPPRGYVKSSTLNGQDTLRAGIDMSSGGRVEVVVSMTAAQIDGTVTNADGQATADAIVTVTPDPVQPGRRDLYKQARSRADGGFTVQGLAPGKYRVFAWEDLEQGANQDPDYMQPFESLGTSVSVEDSDKKTVSVVEITKAKAQDVNRRVGR